MFPNKNRTLSGVKTVLSKIDATGSVNRCWGSSRPRTARSPDIISNIAAEQSDLNFWTPSTTRCGGSYKSVCTNITGSGTWKSCASVSRRNGTVWTRKWLITRTDSLCCSRQRTFWTFTLNITAFVHIQINMFWTLLTLLSLSKTDYFFLYE